MKNNFAQYYASHGAVILGGYFNLQEMAKGGKADFGSSVKSSNFVHTITNKEIQYVISGKGKVRNGTAIQAVVSHLRRSESSVSENKGSKLYKKQEEEHLKSYATENNLWIFATDFKNYISEGAEQKVYLIDGKNVIKVNDSIFYNSWQDYLHSLLLHNYFFPDTAYELMGFMEDNDVLFAVVKQPFVKETEKTEGKDNTRSNMIHNCPRKIY